MDVKYQVFVSSTYNDLIEERRKVTEGILNLGHIPIGMEAFQASDDTQWDYIKRRIDESDYYVVIVAERYGSESEGKSYTQMEYEYAVSREVPVAAFLLDGEARRTWPNERVEHDKKKKLEKFRALCQKKLCKHWRNADDLGSKVILALNELTRERPRTGWVRADTALSPTVANELAVLSEEKRILQQKVEALSGSEILKIPDTVTWRIRELDKATISQLLEEKPSENEISLLEIFQYMVPLFADGCGVREATELLQDVTNIIYESSETEALLRQLVANNIIRFEPRPQYFGDDAKVYYFTDYGKEFVMYAKEWSMRKIGKALEGS